MMFMINKHIGIMGGTFDPIHIGHLLAAEMAKEAGKLDAVWFLPTYHPPHKHHKMGASAEARKRMVKLAIADVDYFHLELMELERGGISYSIDTAIQLTQLYPDVRFTWIIGGDMAQYLPQWVRIEELVQYVSFLGLTRPGYAYECSLLPEFIRDRVLYHEMPSLDISSTMIRERVRAGRSIRYLTPDAVRYYIEQEGLYQGARGNDEVR
jgi:nicotinate-nucleotide adenylyltransferase